MFPLLNQCGVHIYTVPVRLNQFKCDQVKDRPGLGFKASATAFSQTLLKSRMTHELFSCCPLATCCLAWVVPQYYAQLSNQALRRFLIGDARFTFGYSEGQG